MILVCEDLGCLVIGLVAHEMKTDVNSLMAFLVFVFWGNFKITF